MDRPFQHLLNVDQSVNVEHDQSIPQLLSKLFNLAMFRARTEVSYAEVSCIRTIYVCGRIPRKAVTGYA